MKIALVLIVIVLIAGCVAETEEFNENDEAHRMTGECYETVPDTTGHTHVWCGGADYTEEYRSPEGTYHRHEIDEPNNVALAVHGHTHRLR